jgi:iron-sulfur cluster assembly accessory protein
MMFSEETKDNDQIMESNGVNLVFDKSIASFLLGTTIDYIETPNGSGFIFNNPKIKSSCG